MHKHWQGLSPATTATNIMEKNSPVSLDITGPQQPKLETSLELDSTAKIDPREQKEDEEEEKEVQSFTGEDAKRQSLDPEWVEERFRIDRKKLESMLYGEWDSFLGSLIIFTSSCSALEATDCSFWCLSQSSSASALVIYLNQRHHLQLLVVAISNCHALNSCCCSFVIYDLRWLMNSEAPFRFLSFLPGKRRQLLLLVIASWQLYDKCLPHVIGETLWLAHSSQWLCLLMMVRLLKQFDSNNCSLFVTCLQLGWCVSVWALARL